MNRTIIDVFEEHTRVLATSPALCRRDAAGGWESIDWHEYGEMVWDTAAGLAELGVREGDRVALLAANRVEWHVADLAVIAAGAVTVPVYTTSSSSQVAYIAGHAGIRVLIVDGLDQLAKALLRRQDLPALEHVVLIGDNEGLDDDFVVTWRSLVERGRARRAREPRVVADRMDRIALDATATIVYTSGTTGPPKGVVLTHGNVMAEAGMLAAVVGIAPTDRFLSFLPLSHIAERVVSHMGQVISGGQTWFARSITTVAEDLRDCRPTIFFAVPRVWEKLRAAIEGQVASQPGFVQRAFAAYLDRGAGARARVRHTALDWTLGAMLRRKLGLDRARFLASGAAPIDADLLRWFAAIGLPVYEAYGQTETCGATTVSVPRSSRLGAVGRPLAGQDVRIAGDGEILVRGDNVSPGYYENEEGTAELIDRDGWLHSGDIGRLDDDGYLWITGRKKDLIVNSAGKNISPQEIETALEAQPLISHAVVAGDRHPYLVALLTLDTGELRDWAAERGKVGDIETLGQDPDVLDAVAASVERANARHSRVEQIKRWRILPHDFTAADGELTPTLKVKRSAVIEHNQAAVEELYAAAR